MYVCICKKVTEGQIRRAVVEQGVCNLRTLRREVGGCDQCGKCAPEAKQLIRETMNGVCSFVNFAATPN